MEFRYKGTKNISDYQLFRQLSYPELAYMTIDDEFYEYEGFEKPWNRRKIKDMLAHGLIQARCIIIDNNKGAADRIIRKAIIAKLRIGTDINEVWLYERGNKRLFFRDGAFIKDNGEK